MNDQNNEDVTRGHSVGITRGHTTTLVRADGSTVSRSHSVTISAEDRETLLKLAAKYGYGVLDLRPLLAEQNHPEGHTWCESLGQTWCHSEGVTEGRSAGESERGETDTKQA